MLSPHLPLYRPATSEQAGREHHLRPLQRVRRPRQPSTLTLSNGTTTRYTYDSRIYRLKTLHTVKGSTVR